MNFNLQLQEELEKLTPAWGWCCNSAGELPLCVYATSKRNGQQTSPVLVTRSLCEKSAPHEAAQYIYKILARSEPALTARAEITPFTNTPLLDRWLAGARGCAVRWAQGIKGMFLVISPMTR